MSVNITEDKFVISIQRESFDENTIAEVARYLRMEWLAKEVGIEEDLEELGKEIKAEWWKKNKTRLIGE